MVYRRTIQKSIPKKLASITLLFILLSSAMLLLLMTLPVVHAASSTITTAQEFSTASSPERKVFNAVGYWWVFWDNSGTFSYSSSSDGSTWSSVVQPSQFSTESSFSVWFSVSTVYYAASTGSSNFLYDIGTLNSDGTITWATESSIATTYPTSNSIFVITDGLGNPWVALDELQNGGAQYYVDVYELTAGTWSITNNLSFVDSLGYVVAGWVQIVPLTNQSPTVPKVALLYSFEQGTGCCFTGTMIEWTTGVTGGVWSWSSPSNVGTYLTDTVDYAEFSATAIGDNVYIAGSAAGGTVQGIGVSSGVYFSGYTIGSTGSSSLPVNIANGQNWFGSRGTDVSISQGASGSDTLVIFYEDTTALNVEYSISSDLGTTWGSTQIAYAGSATFVSGVSSADSVTSGNTFGVIFTNYATIFNLDFASITAGPLVTTSSTTTTTTTSTTSSTSSSSSTIYLPPRAQISITLNPDLTSNVMDPNNYFLISYNDGAQESIPGQSGTTYFVAAIGTKVTIAAESSGSTSQEKWCLQGAYSGICNQIQFTVASGGNSLTYTYFDILAQSVSYAIHGGGNPLAPTMSFITLPSAANPNDDYALATITLSTTPQTIWALRTFSGAQPVQLPNFGLINTSPPTPNEQWSAGFTSCCAITGPNVVPNPIIFYHQYPQLVSFSVSGRTGFSAPVLTFQFGGKSQQSALGTAPLPLYVDAGSSWSVSNPLPGSTQTYAWKATSSSITSGTISGPGVIDPEYLGSLVLQLTESNGIVDFAHLMPEIQYKLSLDESTFISDFVSTVHQITYKLSVDESTAVSDIINTIHGVQYKLNLVENTLISDVYRPLLPVLIQLTENAGAQDNQNNKVITQPLFSGEILFVVHSPVNILVTDQLGRQAGFTSNSSIINTIPGAQIIPKNGTQLETISIPDPLTGQYTVKVFPVNGGGTYTVESKLMNLNGTVVTDTQQTGSVTSGTQYLGVTLSSAGHVIESAPSTTPPFQQKSNYTTLITILTTVAVAIAALGGSLFISRRRRR